MIAQDLPGHFTAHNRSYLIGMTAIDNEFSEGILNTIDGA
jgi:hypothetical protein